MAEIEIRRCTEVAKYVFFSEIEPSIKGSGNVIRNKENCARLLCNI